jgi:chromosome segregation ATPase
MILKKKKSGAHDNGAMITAQQIAEIGQQVTSLKQKLEIVEREKADLQLQYEALKEEKSKESDVGLAANQLDAINAQFEQTLADYRCQSEAQITSLNQALASQNGQLDQLEANLRLEKENLAQLSKAFEENLAAKEAEIARLTQEKLETKAEVSEVLLNLEEHFAHKTAVLETEREVAAQEKEEQAVLNAPTPEEREAMTRSAQDEAEKIIATARETAMQLVSQAQEEIAEKEAQSQQELCRLRERTDRYASQINETARTIETLLGRVDHL